MIFSFNNAVLLFLEPQSPHQIRLIWSVAVALTQITLKAHSWKKLQNDAAIWSTMKIGPIFGQNNTCMQWLASSFLQNCDQKPLRCLLVVHWILHSISFHKERCKIATRAEAIP